MVDVIHAVCGNIWNFLLSPMEFYFVGLTRSLFI